MTLKKQVVVDYDRKLLFLKVTIEGDKTVLFVQSDKEVEALFKNSVVKNSDGYKCGKKFLKYYDLQENYHRFQDNSPTSAKIDLYGSALIDRHGYNNFSILRTKGIHKGITVEVDRLISEELLTNWAVDLKKYIVFLYKNFVRPIEITVTIQKKEVY